MSYSREVDHATDDESAPPGADLPERAVTPNMLVAYNMTRWRQESGLTQDQLGILLGGWNKTAVSAAERSWDGKRVRQFDADLVTQLAVIFGIPIAGMFLPPSDEGQECRYVIDLDRGATMPMSDYFASYIAPDSGASVGSYVDAMAAVMASYNGSKVSGEIAARLTRRAADDRLGNALSRAVRSSEMLDGLVDSLAYLQGDNDLLRDLLVAMLRETEDGRAMLEAQDKELRRHQWAILPFRREQEIYLAAGLEMFGERGPATTEELDLVAAKGRERGAKNPPVARRRLLDGGWEFVGPVDEGSTPNRETP